MDILGYFKDPSVSFNDKLHVVESIHNSPDINDWQVCAVIDKIGKGVKRGIVDADIGCYAGIYWKPLIFKMQGSIIDTHSHDFPHVTFVVKGTVSINGTVFKNGDMVVVPENVDHKLISLEDDCLAFCISTVKNSMKGELSDSEAIMYGGGLNPYTNIKYLVE